VEPSLDLFRERKLIASPLLEFISYFKFPCVRVGSSTVKSQEKVKGRKAKKSSEDSGEGPMLIAVNFVK